MKRPIALFLALLLPAVLLSACGGAGEQPEEGTVYVHFLDVGQADCTLIHTQDAVILVDAGDPASAGVITDYLADLEIERIDCLVLTHSHEDHIGGAVAVLSDFSVGTCILPNASADTPAFFALLDALEQEGASVMEVCRTDAFVYGGVSLEFLWPEEEALLEEENEGTLVFMASFEANRILFPGDAPASVEEALLEYEDAAALGAQILKVGHHGAKTSTTEEFLEAVSPQYAVISCGRGNAYAYPHIELMTRLLAEKVQIHRTDTDGTVVFCGDGATFSVVE